MNINITGPDGKPLNEYLESLNAEVELLQAKIKIALAFSGEVRSKLYERSKPKPEPKDLTDEEISELETWAESPMGYAVLPTDGFPRLVSEVKRRRKEDAELNNVIGQSFPSWFSIPKKLREFFEKKTRSWGTIPGTVSYDAALAAAQAQPHVHEWVYDRDVTQSKVMPKVRLSHARCSCGATKTEVITEKT